MDRVFTSVRHDLGQGCARSCDHRESRVGISLLLGLGVAATTTLFAFVDAVLLRPLPFDQPDRLVMMFESNVNQNRVREGAVARNILDWVERNDAFDAITAMLTVSATLRGRRRHADRRRPCRRGVSSTSIAANPAWPTFDADEYEGAASITSRQASSGEPVVVLSHRLWQTLGADPQILDRTVSVEGRDWRVIGVMPEDFVVPDATATFWAPWDMRTSYRGARFPNGPPRDARFLRVVGRMKAGMSIEGAAARMQTLAGGIAVRASGHERRLERSARSARG